MRFRSISIVVLATAAACDRGGVSLATSRGTVSTAIPRVVINEIMANPQATPDERGEWIELRNLDATAVDLRGWTVASANDPGITIQRSTVIAPNGIVLLARGADHGAGDAAPVYVYGSGLALGNGSDWIAVRLPDGRTTDCVAWTSAAPGVS